MLVEQFMVELREPWLILREGAARLWFGAIGGLRRWNSLPRPLSLR